VSPAPREAAPTCPRSAQKGAAAARASCPATSYTRWWWPPRCHADQSTRRADRSHADHVVRRSGGVRWSV